MFARDDLKITSKPFDDYIGVESDDVSGYALCAIIRATNIAKGLAIDDKDFAKKTHVDVRYPVEFNFNSDARYVIAVNENVKDAEIVPPEGFLAMDGKNGTSMVDKYLSQISPTRIFINRDEERAYIFTASLNERWVRNLVASWPMIATWDFGDKKEVLAVSSAVSKKTSGYEEMFASYVESLTHDIDFRNIFLIGSIKGMAAHAAENQLRNAQNNLEETLSNIRDCEDRLQRYSAEYANLTVLVKALMSAESASDEAYIKCFSDRKNVTVMNRLDGDLYYYVTDTLEYYDEDEFLRLYKKSSSYLYQTIENDCDVAKALYCLFYKRVGEVVVSAQFTLNDGSYVKSKGDKMPRKDRAPQPHIYFYGCDGGNSAAYAQYAKTGDFELGVDQSISATKNINWGDSAVVPRFVEWLAKHSSAKFITMNHDVEDTISLDEYIEKMKEEPVWPD